MFFILWISGTSDALEAWCPDTNAVVPLTVGSRTLQVEIAADRASRRCGLSDRKTLAPDTGMLFVFETEALLTFWMRDTEVPLSIAYLDNEGVILDIQQMKIENPETRYRSAQPARYALEVPMGWFTSNDVTPGMKCYFLLPQKQDGGAS